MRADQPLSRAAVLFGYVLPVLGVAALLAVSGLWGLAVLLVAGEVVMSAVVLAVRRRPARSAPGPARRPWLVPLVMVGLLTAMVGVAMLAAQAG